MDLKAAKTREDVLEWLWQDNIGSYEQYNEALTRMTQITAQAILSDIQAAFKATNGTWTSSRAKRLYDGLKEKYGN